jgi:IS30 family transposase
MGTCYDQLCAEERGVIMAMTLDGHSARAIAGTLRRSPSTISRERRRNGWKCEIERGPIGRPTIAGGYDAKRAGARARGLRAKPRVARKLANDTRLWREVQGYLARRFSPEQIAGTLKRCYPESPLLQVSPETIYRAIYAYPRGALRRALTRLLRQGRAARRAPRCGEERRGKLPDLPSIHLRPPEANDRLLPGHWEGDLLIGSRNRSAVGTLVDRKTLFVMLVKMAGTSAHAALEGYANVFAPLDPTLRKTLTYDQGKEMAFHKLLAQRTGLHIYFADPHSPWQRGINENINGLLREYLPKNEDLSRFSQYELDRIAWELNTRPRKTLGFLTPAEIFYEHCFNERLRLPLSVALGP